MITKERKEYLKRLNTYVAKSHGFLSTLYNAGVINDEEESFLFSWNDKIEKTIDELEQDWHKSVENDRPKMAEFKKEIEASFPVAKYKLEWVNGKIGKLARETKAIIQGYDEGRKADVPLWLRQAVLDINGYDDKQRELHRLVMARSFIEDIAAGKVSQKPERIPDEQIAAAKAISFDRLLPFTRTRQIKCPFHEAKKSKTLWWFKKDNSVRCWSCGWHGNTIRYIMEKEGIRFKEAVKYLLHY